MTWHILGAGSIGALWACRLAAAKLDPCLILRSPEKLERYHTAQGLRLGDSCYPIAAELTTSPRPITKLLLACKAYDAQQAVASIAARITPGATLILLQNGLGSQDEVQALAPNAQCVLGASTEGAYRPSEFEVVPAGVGINMLGAMGHAEPDCLAELNSARIPYQWSENIQARLWHKLAVNCAINPLTVLYNCRNGQLLEHQAELLAIIAELKQLLVVHGHQAVATDLTDDIMRVITATALNFSSMQQDVAHQRRTEIHYLLGFAIRQSKAQGLGLPHLATLYQRLKGHLQAHGLPSH